MRGEAVRGCSIGVVALGSVLRIVQRKREASAMPLTPTFPDAICDIDVVSFLMFDEDSLVRVDVQRAVLQRFTPLRSDEAHLAVFDAHRCAIEKVASEKFDEGDFGSFPNCRVVPIGPADLPRIAHSRTELAA
jgi:hypothetical protein